jgi:DNA replication protein DnaC
MGEPAPLATDDIPPVLAERLAKYQEADAEVVHIPRNETPEEAAERHDRARAHRVARWVAHRPVLYADAKMDDVSDLAAARWWNTESDTLILAGPVGTGKTHTAYAIGNMAVEFGVWSEAYTVSDLLEALRPGGDGAYGARQCDLLVLDDLGAQTPTPWAVETLTALVDARIRESRRQIVTTNAPYEALETAWCGRLIDRLAYRWTVVTLTGPSRRRAAW